MRRFALTLVLLVLPKTAHAAGALEVLVQEATQSLGTTAASTVVVAAPLAADQKVRKPDELVLRLAALVAGHIGATARAQPQTATLPAARAIAGRVRMLV